MTERQYLFTHSCIAILQKYTCIAHCGSHVPVHTDIHLRHTRQHICEGTPSLPLATERRGNRSGPGLSLRGEKKKSLQKRAFTGTLSAAWSENGQEAKPQKEQ